MVIGITGLPGAGKGTAAAYLVEKYGAVTKRFSQPLWDILARLHQQQTRENMQKLAQSMRAIFGDDILAETLLQDLAQETTKPIVMEGFRYQDEYAMLKRRPDFVFVGIETKFDARLARIQQRSEKDDDRTMTAEKFKLQHEYKTEQFIPELIAKADHRIDNNNTVEVLYSQLDALMTKLKV
ncbi:MAG: AAA family ATPase [Patescibacteria group bacterium]